MTSKTPSLLVPVVGAGGQVTPSWHQFFTRLAAGPGAAQVLQPQGSEHSFSANSDGFVVISGGTVSGLTLTRGTTTVNLGAVAGSFPAKQGDVFKLTYSVAPTVHFMPG